jgi:hypothetical protein
MAIGGARRRLRCFRFRRVRNDPASNGLLRLKRDGETGDDERRNG